MTAVRSRGLTGPQMRPSLAQMARSSSVNRVGRFGVVMEMVLGLEKRAVSPEMYAETPVNSSPEVHLLHAPM